MSTFACLSESNCRLQAYGLRVATGSVVSAPVEEQLIDERRRAQVEAVGAQAVRAAAALRAA